MFRFIYALSPNERLDPASLRMDEFDGFEASDDADHGVAVEGVRSRDLNAAVHGLETVAKWASYQPQSSWRETVQTINRVKIPGLLFVEPSQDCQTVRELWIIIESITHKNVKLAWSADWGSRTDQPPAAVISVLNLKIGLVRVGDAGDMTLDLVKRLAGIGFEGLFVVDPPQSSDRLGEARRIVEIVRDIISPRKPVKAAIKKSP